MKTPPPFLLTPNAKLSPVFLAVFSFLMFSSPFSFSASVEQDWLDHYDHIDYRNDPYTEHYARSGIIEISGSEPDAGLDMFLGTKSDSINDKDVRLFYRYPVNVNATVASTWTGATLGDHTYSTFLVTGEGVYLDFISDSLTAKTYNYLNVQGAFSIAATNTVYSANSSRYEADKDFGGGTINIASGSVTLETHENSNLVSNVGGLNVVGKDALIKFWDSNATKEIGIDNLGVKEASIVVQKLGTRSAGYALGANVDSGTLVLAADNEITFKVLSLAKQYIQEEDDENPEAIIEGHAFGLYSKRGSIVNSATLNIDVSTIGTCSKDQCEDSDYMGTGSAFGIYATSESGRNEGVVAKIESSGAVNIDSISDSQLAVGVYLSDQGTTGDFSGNLNLKSIQSNKDDAYGLYVTTDARLTANGGFVANINKDGLDEHLNKARAIEALGGGQVFINTQGSSLVQVDGDLHTRPESAELNTSSDLNFQIEVLSWVIRKQDVNLGSLRSVANALAITTDDTGKSEKEKITFVMNRVDSFLTGAANGNIDMTVATDTRWDVTGDSDFTQLRAVGGLIDLYHENIQFNELNPFQKVTVQTLSSTGLNTQSTSPSSFVMNTDILGKGVEVLSFDGTTFYKKNDGDGLKNASGEVDGEGFFTKNPTYTFNCEEIEIEFEGFKENDVKTLASYELRHGDFLNVVKSDAPQTHYVQIVDSSILNGQINYTNQVLKFATTPANVTLVTRAVDDDTSAFKYLPKVWTTTHTEQTVKDGVVQNVDAVVSDGKIRDEAANTTWFTREEYEQLVAAGDLVTTEDTGTIITDGMIDYWISGYDKTINNPGDLVTSLYGIQFNDAQLTTLRKRLGEVRYGAQDGLWIKALAQKDGTSGIVTAGYEQELYGLNLGIDRLVSVSEETMWLVGGNLKQAHAMQELLSKKGDGETDSYGLNLYATWANYKGSYADFVLSADWYRQKLHTVNESNVSVRGKYNTWGFGASIEIGRMFSTGDDDLSWGPWYQHWFLEPQAQLSYYWLKGKDFVLSNGARVRQKNSDNLTGRLGLVLGTKFNYGEDREEIDKCYSQFYIKGGIKHDFLGSRAVYVGSDKFESDDIGTTTIYYGLGFDWNLADQWRMYFQAEREKGDGYEKDYEVSIGLKWQY